MKSMNPTRTTGKIVRPGIADCVEPSTVIKPLTEKEFQWQVRKTAELLGWMVYCTHDSRRSPAGFPDLVLAKAPRVIFAELKVKNANTKKGRPTEEQLLWLEILDHCPGVEQYLWRLDHWDDVERVLKGE